MNFRAHQDIDDVQGTLPQFSELRGLLNPMEFTGGGNMQGGTAQGRSVYTTGAREASQLEMQSEVTVRICRDFHALVSLVSLFGFPRFNFLSLLVFILLL